MRFFFPPLFLALAAPAAVVINAQLQNYPQTISTFPERADTPITALESQELHKAGQKRVVTCSKSLPHGHFWKQRHLTPKTPLEVQEECGRLRGEQVEEAGLRGDLRKAFLPVRHFNRLSRDAVEAPSLAVLKSRLDVALSKLL